MALFGVGADALSPIGCHPKPGWNIRESPQVLEKQREARVEARLERGKKDVQRAIHWGFGTPIIPTDLADQLAVLRQCAILVSQEKGPAWSI
jgi:hypothetical protein